MFYIRTYVRYVADLEVCLCTYIALCFTQCLACVRSDSVPTYVTFSVVFT